MRLDYVLEILISFNHAKIVKMLKLWYCLEEKENLHFDLL